MRLTIADGSKSVADGWFIAFSSQFDGLRNPSALKRK
jgi:hypothetical protein